MSSLLSMLRIVVVMAALLFASPAIPHMTLDSQVNLTIHADRVHAEIIIPRSEYAAATANPVSNDSVSGVRAAAYIANSLAVSAPGGQAWAVNVTAAEFVIGEGPPDLRAIVVLTPPAGASTRNFTIEWRALAEALSTHSTLFVIQRDIAGGAGTQPQIVGATRAGANRITIDAGTASRWHELRNAMVLGTAHIVEGYDHLIFLIALLLVAPLTAATGRWTGVRDARSSARRTVGLVTAFTIGHSLTLIAATLAHWQLPAQPVEVVIAISVFVSALHAARPVFPAYEPVVAGAFGLVHGLAFATLLSDLSPGSDLSAVALLGFNLGIEAVQLVIVLLLLPALMIAARHTRYQFLRLGVATAAMAAATAWVIDRAFGFGGDVAELANYLIAGVTVALIGFSVAAMAIFVLQWRGGSKQLC